MSVAPTVSRLSQCPCGSGKRYKNCHGALAPSPDALPAAAISRRSSYRPSGPEWNLLPETDRDRLGVLMEGALVYQREGRAGEAERNYRDVLAIAPKTHDALHMLAMTRFSEGDFVEARRLIEEALPLRPEYPAIRQNHLLVISAVRARERSAQEALCEKALARLFDLMRSPEGRSAQRATRVTPDEADRSLYLIGIDGGSEGDDAWMLRRLAFLLEPAKPVVWTARGQDFGNPREDDDVSFPAGGIQVWVGVDVEISDRLARAEPNRTLVFLQSASPSRWLEMLRAIAADGARPLELVTGSKAKAARFGAGHRVLPAPIDLAEIAEATRQRTERPEEFIVGNVVQDGRVIPHARAGSLQEQVAKAGFRLDLYDPGRIRHAVGAMRNVRCISRHDLTLVEFLAPLACYLYCCESWWKEGLGRDLFGAMAFGMPVLCPRTSMHAEYIRDGVDGILYDGDAGALASLAALRDDPARCIALGAAGRESARRMFDARELADAYRRLVTRA